MNFCSQPLFAGNILIEDGVYPKQSMTKVGVATCVQTFLVISKILFVKMLFWIAQMVNMICACYLNIKHLNKISQYMKHGICILLVLALSTSHSSNCIPVWAPGGYLEPGLSMLVLLLPALRHGGSICKFPHVFVHPSLWKKWRANDRHRTNINLDSHIVFVSLYMCICMYNVYDKNDKHQ